MSESTPTPIPANIKAYWLRIVRGYCYGLDEDQADAVAEYAARDAIEHPERPCGVWHAAHVVLKTARCHCAVCSAGPSFPVHNIH